MRRIVALLVVATLALAACGSSDDDDSGSDGTSLVASGEGVALVGAEAFNDAVGEPGVVVIDVRTPAEFAEGHLAGAQLIDIQDAGFQTAIEALPRDGAYAVYCRSGNRSAAATRLMSDLGFSNVTELDGGIQAWTAAGLPVEQ